MASSYSAKEEDGHHSGSAGLGGTAIRTRKPDNTAFKQQRLPAWQPILTAGTVLPAFFVIGLIFIPIGIGLYVTSNNIKEIEIDYTGTDMSSPCFNCSQSFSWNSTTPCKCVLSFSLDQPFEEPSKECEPYRVNVKPIAPCGAIANSMFNDTLDLFYHDPNGTKTQIPLIKKGIAWWTDKHVKFRNPPGSNLTAVFIDTAKPVNWHKPVYELDTDSDNNGFINEDFIVWMRTAALPTFRKLYRIIQKKNNQTPTLPRGNYTLEVTYNYPVRSFEGRKRMILSTISWMGGKNPFLGIAYITVGSICFFLGVVLLFIHHKYGNRNNSSDIPS
ncbi:Cell cycle control protein 50A [Anabarilius grahami]|uniref:Cell cycle control protein n=1 Tax=Anabarilius grahami TaxID=495550 RepID=A0A3N0YJA2_ANAGA|nr:Cell cycle control protein 50A [Anabarilius grahami]